MRSGNSSVHTRNKSRKSSVFNITEENSFPVQPHIQCTQVLTKTGTNVPTHTVTQTTRCHVPENPLYPFIADNTSATLLPKSNPNIHVTDPCNDSVEEASPTNTNSANVTEPMDGLEVDSDKMNTKGIKKMDDLYNAGNIGYVTMYYNHFRDRIVCVSKNTFYVYNDETEQWILQKACDIKTHFLSNIKQVIDPLIQHYISLEKKAKDIGNVGLAAEYEKHYKMILNTPEFNKICMMTRLFPKIVSKFYAPNFMERLTQRVSFVPCR